MIDIFDDNFLEIIFRHPRACSKLRDPKMKLHTEMIRYKPDFFLVTLNLKSKQCQIPKAPTCTCPPPPPPQAWPPPPATSWWNPRGPRLSGLCTRLPDGKICSLPFLGLRPPPWRNPRKGRDQILPSGNHDPHRVM